MVYFLIILGIENPVDTYYLIDASVDVRKSFLDAMKGFVAWQGKVIGISKDKRMSVYSYGKTPRLLLAVKDGTSVDRLKDAVDKIANTREPRKVAEALKRVKDSIASEGQRSNIGKVVVTFITGDIMPFDLLNSKSEADELRRLGTAVFVVAIGPKVNKIDALSIVKDKENLADADNVQQLPYATAKLSDVIKNAQKVSGEVDVGFIWGVDGPGAEQDFSNEKWLILKLLDKLDVASDRIKVGLIIYGVNARLIMRFDEAKNKGEIIKAIESLSPPQPGLGLGRALELGRLELFNERYGARRGKPKTAFVISNYFDDARAKESAEGLRKQDVRIVAILTGDSGRAGYINDIANVDRGVITFGKGDDLQQTVNTMVAALLPGELK